MNWWRAHHGIANDPKLALVAMSRHVTPCHATRGDILAVWVSLLDFASQNNPRGSVHGYDCEELAWSLEMPTEKVAAIVNGFRDRHMIEGEMLAAWEKRQTKRERDDPTAAERKRKQRERHMDTGHAHTQQTGAQDTRDNDTPARIMSMSENGNVTPSHAMSPTEERRGEVSVCVFTKPGNYFGEEEPRPEFRADVAFEELWAAYPAKGRTKKPLSQQYYCEEIRNADTHAHVISQIKARWIPSEKWHKGFVLSLPEFIHNRCWDESPESHSAAQSLRPVAVVERGGRRSTADIIGERIAKGEKPW